MTDTTGTRLGLVSGVSVVVGVGRIKTLPFSSDLNLEKLNPIAPCKGIRILESEKIWLVESAPWALEYGIGLKESGPH